MYNETISKELCKHIRFYVVKSPDNEYNFYIWAEKDIELGLGFDIYSDRCNVNRYVAIINNILTNKVTHGFINYKCIRLDCITTRVDISKKYLVYNYGNRTIEFIYPLLIKPSQICIEMDCSDKFYLSINIDKILDASIFSCNINRIKHRIGFNPYNYEMQVQERTKCTKSIVPNQNLLCTKDDKSIEDIHNDILDKKEVDYMNLEIPKELCKHIRFYAAYSLNGGFYIWADITNYYYTMSFEEHDMVRRYVELINKAIYEDFCIGYLRPEKIEITSHEKYCANYYLVIGACSDNRIKDNLLSIIPSHIIIGHYSNCNYISIDIDTISEINPKDQHDYIASMIGFNPYNYEMQVQERAKNIVSNQNLLCTKEDKSIEDMYNDIWDNKEKSSLNKEVNCMNNKLEYKELEIPEKLCKYIRFYAANSPSGEGFYIWPERTIDYNMDSSKFCMIKMYFELINKVIYKGFCTGYLHLGKLRMVCKEESMLFSPDLQYCVNNYLVSGECNIDRINDNLLLIIPSYITIDQDGYYQYINIGIDSVTDVANNDKYIRSKIGFNPYKNKSDTIFEGKIMKLNEKNKNGRIYPAEVIIDSLPGGSRVNIFGSIDFNIKKVIHNDFATVVFWETGDKTVVKRQNGEEKDDLEKAIMAAYMKKAISRGYNSHERSMEEVLDRVKSDLAQQQQQNDKKSKKKKK